MTLWRFVQGLLLPPIFTVTVAYIGDEWPPSDVARVAGIYISGSSVGGFCGRFIPGVLTDWIGWREAIQVVALITLGAAIIVALALPRERNFVRSGGVLSSLVQMLCRRSDAKKYAPAPLNREHGTGMEVISSAGIEVWREAQIRVVRRNKFKH